MSMTWSILQSRTNHVTFDRRADVSGKGLPPEPGAADLQIEAQGERDEDIEDGRKAEAEGEDRLREMLVEKRADSGSWQAALTLHWSRNRLNSSIWVLSMESQSLCGTLLSRGTLAFWSS